MSNVKDVGFWLQVVAEVKAVVTSVKAASKDGFTVAEVLEIVSQVLGVLKKHGVSIDEVSKLIADVAPLIALIAKK